MKKLLLLIALTIPSAIAYAQVDVGAAFGGALVTIVIRGAIAFGLFKLITVNLTRKTTFTPVENGRWVGAWLAGISLISFPSTNKSAEDFYFGVALVSLVWLLVGFAIGYVWRKFKPLQLNGDIAHKAGLVSMSGTISNNSESKYWEMASNELNSDQRNVGLWAQCFSQSDGDVNKAQAGYLSYRFKELSSENQHANASSILKIKPKGLLPRENEIIFGILLVVVMFAVLAYYSGGEIWSFVKSNGTNISSSPKNQQPPKIATNSSQPSGGWYPVFFDNESQGSIDKIVKAIEEGRVESIQLVYDRNLKLANWVNEGIKSKSSILITITKNSPPDSATITYERSRVTVIVRTK